MKKQRAWAMIDGVLCLSTAALAKLMGIDPTAAMNTIAKGMQRHRQHGGAWQHYQDANDGRAHWLVWDAIPEQAQSRTLFALQAPDATTAYWAELLKDAALGRIEVGDSAHFAAHKRYTTEQVSQLAQACGWLRLCSAEGWWLPYDMGGKIAGMKTATLVIEPLKLYGLRVSNWQSLDLKAKRWVKEGRDSLVSGLVGNQNKKKSGEQAPYLRMLHLYAQPIKLHYTQVCEIYNREAADKGWPQYSAERVRQIITDNRSAWIYARDGVQAGRAQMERTLKRSRPDYADELWTVDGTTLQLGYAADGKKQFRKAWTVVIVADCYSDCVIGWAAGSTETQELVLRAMRMAIRRKGYGPAFIQFDNGGANKSRQVADVLERMETVGIPAQPYNGRAKYVERILGRLEQGLLRTLPNFYGGNVTARSQHSRVNPDYISALLAKGQMPMEPVELLKQFAEAVQVYNHTVVKKYQKTPAELYDVADTRRRGLSQLDVVSLFWVKRPEVARYNTGGLAIQVDGQKLEYEVQTEPGLADMAFHREHVGDSFVVRYDPENSESVCLYDQEDRYMAMATLKYAFKAVPNKEDSALLKEALGQRKNEISRGLQEAQAIAALMEESGMEEVSFQHVHKDAYNRAQERNEAYLAGMDLNSYLVAAPKAVSQSGKKASATQRSPYYDLDKAAALLNAPDLDDF